MKPEIQLEAAAVEGVAQEKVRFLGDLPEWGKDDLPEPLPFSLRNLIRTIGPGAILLATSIGGGEWLAGPAMAVQFGRTDILIRTVTDIAWVGSRKARAWRGGDIRKIYYALLFGFTLWGMVAVNWADAMSLFKVIANVAGLVLAIASIQVLRVNSKLLPAELRPPFWRKMALLACSIFYGTIFTLVLWSIVFGQVAFSDSPCFSVLLTLST
ncbi:MAG TPA: hypothetical protein VNO70_01355 [Blastocatellia bacterium]|nr:hypothetical protein [Blastocatellia bacterium]